jgi:hypothetical protein
MRLVSSSILGAVEEDRAVRLLAERAVLTRAICCELRDENPDPGSGRSRTALGFLVEWIRAKNLGPFTVSGVRDGLDQMVVPDGCQAIFREIEAGAQVGEALSMLSSADSPREWDGDVEKIRKCLTTYWREHPVAIR